MTSHFQPASAGSPLLLKTRAGDLDLSRRVHIMGILNATPDSFSDGGRYMTPESAIARAEAMIEEGADILDIGGESSRPGASPVAAEEEASRVLPIVEILAQRFPRVPISVDTVKASVARRALEEGASILNDISALRDDPDMPRVLREHGVPVVLMHRLGVPLSMQADPRYEDVVGEIGSFFKERLAFLGSAGLSNQVILDPGIGFGKTLEHNLAILRELPHLLAFGKPLLVGASRKSFLGKLTETDGAVPPAGDRLEASLASGLWSAMAGARILRVHDVKSTYRALITWSAISGGG